MPSHIIRPLTAGRLKCFCMPTHLSRATSTTIRGPSPPPSVGEGQGGGEIREIDGNGDKKSNTGSSKTGNPSRVGRGPRPHLHVQPTSTTTTSPSPAGVVWMNGTRSRSRQARRGKEGVPQLLNLSCARLGPQEAWSTPPGHSPMGAMICVLFMLTLTHNCKYEYVRTHYMHQVWNRCAETSLLTRSARIFPHLFYTIVS